MPTSTRTLSLAALLAAAASGHVVLENPKPFPFIDYGPTNPVAADGQDFPCKVPPGTKLDTSAPATVMAVGEDQTLSFQGRAVHGGGSCQLALTRDAQPTKQSEWLVIHSIEGGCPARHQKGNLEGPNTDKYTFRIPAAIAPGDYVFSWTWNARIGGQPEFYQNCAPITVTAPPTKKRQRLTDRRAAAAALARRADFPPLFMANMGAAAGGCTTQDALTQQQAIAYPNPGASVDRPEGDAALFPQPCDGNPRAGTGVKPPKKQPGDGDGDAPASSSSSSTAPASTPSATTTTTAAAVSSTSAEGPATTSAATTTPAASSTPATSAAPPAETTTTTQSPTSPAVPVPSGGADGDDGPSASCTHGQLACFDGGKTAWSCTGNAWVKIADAPAGMQCTPGVGQGENLVWKPE